ncbi:LacI family DNA-binding transcriptional regulator [Spongisporangium articulatum]|uniref:LacI family DNA-binding transcriptional regulator n=1 Tax=Spongisporangium articulatum TaxID=3362603 RepID=A0ABW8AW21_9ACTN
MTTGALPRRVTARDVARRVGCSVATVSLVVNGKGEGRVASSTQQLIWEAVADLGYRLNQTASALARGRSSTIGFVCPDPTNPFFSMVLEGLSGALDDELSLTLLMPNQGSDYDLGTLQRALAGDFAGLIIATPGRHLMDGFVPTCPTLLLDAAEAHPRIPGIDLDVVGAAGQLADHLAGLGHRAVGYVGVSRDKASLQTRRQALASSLERLGSAVVADLELDVLTLSSARDAFSTAWPAWDAAGVTAVVCGDELHAYGVLQAARTLGIDVPGRLSLVGFNDLPYSELVQPRLTSVNLSALDLGAAAGAALQEYLITGEPPATTMLPTRLVVRESTARASR